MAAASPNEIASIVLRRIVQPDGSERWAVTTRVSSSVVSPLRALYALKSAITMAVDQCLEGRLPAPGNGDVDGVTLHVTDRR